MTELPKYDCGILPYSSGGGFKAWFFVPRMTEKRFLTATRSGKEIIIRFKEAESAWRAAKDRMLKSIHSDIRVWHDEQTLELRKPQAIQEINKLFGGKDGKVFVRPGVTVEVARKKRRGQR